MKEIKDIINRLLPNATHFSFHADFLKALEADTKAKAKVADQLEAYKTALKKEEEPVKCVLFENEDFRIVGDFIHPVDRAELPMIDKFCEALDYPHSEDIIFQAQDKKKPSELGGCYFTDFSIDTEHHLYLQKIAQEEDEVKTYLISFEKKTGKVEVVKEIGQYVLEHYNEKTKTITGYGKEKVIHITLE